MKKPAKQGADKKKKRPKGMQHEADKPKIVADKPEKCTDDVRKFRKVHNKWADEPNK